MSCANGNATRDTALRHALRNSTPYPLRTRVGPRAFAYRNAGALPYVPSQPVPAVLPLAASLSRLCSLSTIRATNGFVCCRLHQSSQQAKSRRIRTHRTHKPSEVECYAVEIPQSSSAQRGFGSIHQRPSCVANASPSCFRSMNARLATSCPSCYPSTELPRPSRLGPDECRLSAHCVLLNARRPIHGQDMITILR